MLLAVLQATNKNQQTTLLILNISDDIIYNLIRIFPTGTKTIKLIRVKAETIQLKKQANK